MTNETIELIAIGASVTANCQPCLHYHLGKARECGVSDADAAEAVRVGRMVRKGAQHKMDLAIDEALGRQAPQPAGARTGSCCG